MTKTYKVSCSIPVHLTITVQAESDADAIERALEYAALDIYVGNGGSDKLVGTGESCVSIEPGDSVLEGDGWSISAREASISG